MSNKKRSAPRCAGQRSPDNNDKGHPRVAFVCTVNNTLTSAPRASYRGSSLLPIR
jgi:hypothetical protein